MKRVVLAVGIIAMTAASGSGRADERTVTLEVDNLFCASCPTIVEKTLSRVPGVDNVMVSFDEKTAVVSFDDGETDVATLTAATAAVGFPSRPVDTAAR